MVLTLVIGDRHIPTRSQQVPPKFKALLVRIFKKKFEFF